LRISLILLIVNRHSNRTLKAESVDKNRLYSLIYPLVLTTLAVVVLTVLGVTGNFYWSYTLTFLTAACILAEWQFIRLPQGNSLTLSIIFILLALVFDFEPASDWQRAIIVYHLCTWHFTSRTIFYRPLLLA
jgi:uncharacterized membrane protein